MKTKLILFLSAIVTMAFMNSCSNDLDGDQSKLNGKPGYLTIHLKDSKMRTKAMGNPGTDENAIDNFTVFVFRDASNNVYDVDPIYFDSYPGDNTDIEIKITSQATSVYIVTNLGNPYESTSLLGGALSVASGNIFDAQLDLDGLGATTQEAEMLTQSGYAELDWSTPDAPTALVPLYFVASRISVSEVNLFDLNKTLVDVADADLTLENKALMQNKGIASIEITSVAVFNVPQYTYLVESSSTRLDDNSSLYLYDNTGTTLYEPSNASYDFNSGTYYPVNPYTTSTVSFLEETSFGAKIPSDTGDYPYFYVWENYQGSKAKNEGITFVTIACKVTSTGGQESSNFYTIPITSDISGNYTDYSTRHGYHYKITANISGKGTDNPYETLINANIQAQRTAWEEVPVTYTAN